MTLTAILTGDLIGSTEVAPAATLAALEVIAATAAEIAAWPPQPDAVVARFTRFRGDGWQFATPLAQGPRAALLVTARLVAARGLHSRIALGFGTVEDWGQDGTLSQARGPALTASGRMLDRMDPGEYLALAGEADMKDHALLRLLATLIRRWSPEQAEVAAFGLTSQPLKQFDLAKRLKISAQAVSQRLKAAEAATVFESLGLWEAALDETALAATSGAEAPGAKARNTRTPGKRLPGALKPAARTPNRKGSP